MTDPVDHRAALLRRLLDENTGQAPADAPPADAEHLALVAMGRIDALSPDERRAVLERVAADRREAMLLADLCSAPWIDEGRRPLRPRSGLARINAGALAAAACVLIGLAVWRFADPPAPLNADGSIKPYQSARQVDYWQQLDRQRLIDRARRDRYRDYALVTSTATCLVLSIPLACTLLRRRLPRRA
jgi:hypothetical protein